MRSDDIPTGGDPTPALRVIAVRWQDEPALRLEGADGASATVLLHGAHLVSWMPRPGDERLYLSPAAVHGEGQAIRGGVPVIFPQFDRAGPDTTVPRHGFARNRRWQAAGPLATLAGGEAATVPEARLGLAADEATRRFWPQGFRIELAIALAGPALQLTLSVANTGPTAFGFTAALHTYLAVDAIERARVVGLQGIGYADKALGTDGIEAAAELAFAGEVDRLYRRTPPALRLQDGRRHLVVAQHGFEDTVVWNPWRERCAALVDMPADGYRRMVCIEAAQVARPVTLAPGADWRGSQRLRVDDADEG